MDNKSEKTKKNRTELNKIKINTPDPGYEPFPVSIINRSTYEALTFNPLLGKPATISYKLTNAGYIRLRIVRKDNPDLILLTLQDWTKQEFGIHEVKWDGRDASGNIIDNKKALILFDTKETTFDGKHREHDEKICNDLKLVIETDPSLSQKVQGELEIRTSISGESVKSIINPGCEVRHFLNYSHVKTERFENIPDTFKFRLDTTELVNGEHFFTVNVSDLNDHTGTASLKINVEN